MDVGAVGRRRRRSRGVRDCGGRRTTRWPGAVRGGRRGGGRWRSGMAHQSEWSLSPAPGCGVLKGLFGRPGLLTPSASTTAKAAAPARTVPRDPTAIGRQSGDALSPRLGAPTKLELWREVLVNEHSMGIDPSLLTATTSNRRGLGTRTRLRKERSATASQQRGDSRHKLHGDGRPLQRACARMGPFGGAGGAEVHEFAFHLSARSECAGRRPADTGHAVWRNRCRLSRHAATGRTELSDVPSGQRVEHPDHESACRLPLGGMVSEHERKHHEPASGLRPLGRSLQPVRHAVHRRPGRTSVRQHRIPVRQRE